MDFLSALVIAGVLIDMTFTADVPKPNALRYAPSVFLGFDVLGSLLLWFPMKRRLAYIPDRKQIEIRGLGKKVIHLTRQDAVYLNPAPVRANNNGTDPVLCPEVTQKGKRILKQMLRFSAEID